MRSKKPFLLLSVALFLVAALAGCAVKRGQSTVGEYIDDSIITTQVKARYVQAKSVDATSIRVETLDGTVMLSGFAKSQTEKDAAEDIAAGVKGVKQVKNQLIVRPAE